MESESASYDTHNGYGSNQYPKSLFNPSGSLQSEGSMESDTMSHTSTDAIFYTQTQIQEMRDTLTELIRQAYQHERDLKAYIEALKSNVTLKFDGLPTLDTLLKTFEKLINKLTIKPGKISRKKWWIDEEVLIFSVCVVCYAFLKQEEYDEISEEGWKFISQIMISKDIEQMKERWQSYLKNNVTKAPWTPQEDEVLLKIIQEKGTTKKWKEIAQELKIRTNADFLRHGRQCRERWNNHLDPNINRGAFTEEEDIKLLQSFLQVGKKWAEISKIMGTRTENSVKNRFLSLIKKLKSKQNIALWGLSNITESGIEFEKLIAQKYILSQNPSLINVFNSKSDGKRELQDVTADRNKTWNSQQSWAEQQNPLQMNIESSKSGRRKDSDSGMLKQMGKDDKLQTNQPHQFQGNTLPSDRMTEASTKIPSFGLLNMSNPVTGSFGMGGDSPQRLAQKLFNEQFYLNQINNNPLLAQQKYLLLNPFWQGSPQASMSQQQVGFSPQQFPFQFQQQQSQNYNPIQQLLTSNSPNMMNSNLLLQPNYQVINSNGGTPSGTTMTKGTFSTLVNQENLLANSTGNNINPLEMQQIAFNTNNATTGQLQGNTFPSGVEPTPNNYIPLDLNVNTNQATLPKNSLNREEGLKIEEGENQQHNRMCHKLKLRNFDRNYIDQLIGQNKVVFAIVDATTNEIYMTHAVNKTNYTPTLERMRGARMSQPGSIVLESPYHANSIDSFNGMFGNMLLNRDQDESPMNLNFNFNAERKNSQR